jgi:hypothetical protein
MSMLAWLTPTSRQRLRRDACLPPESYRGPPYSGNGDGGKNNPPLLVAGIVVRHMCWRNVRRGAFSAFRQAIIDNKIQRSLVLTITLDRGLYLLKNRLRSWHKKATLLYALVANPCSRTARASFDFLCFVFHLCANNSRVPNQITEKGNKFSMIIRKLYRWSGKSCI